MFVQDTQGPGFDLQHWGDLIKNLKENFYYLNNISGINIYITQL